MAAIRRGTPLPLRAWLLPLLGNLAVAIVILVLRERVLPLTIAITASLRILGSAWNVLASPVLASNDAGDTALVDLGLGDRPEMLAMANRIEDEEIARGGFDREWIVGFTATLFALHAGRMGFEASLLGMLSPAVAVHRRLVHRRAHRLVHRRASAPDVPQGHPAAGAPGVGAHRRGIATAGRRDWPSARRAVWLEARLRFAIRLRQARYSPRLALRRGLRTGLPAAAVIAATVPVWGMNWYFDTENWAAGVWNSWAEARTDTWREAMVRSVMASQPARRWRQRICGDARRAAGRRRLRLHRHRRHRRRGCVAARAA